MQEDAVEPQIEESIEQVLEEVPQEVNNPEVSEDVEIGEKPKKMVPVHALQKEREKRKELELELQWERQRNAEREAAVQKPVEEDTSRYETPTKADLSRAQFEAVRMIEERQWIKNHPEKFEKLETQLKTFLQKRPNLRSAINDAVNRYEEAYELMDKLSPKEQQQLKVSISPKKEAPHSPGGVPKATALNETVDVMNMSDNEFAAWRASKKIRR